MANVKISELPAAAALDGSELVPIVQSGATVQTTADDVAALVTGGLTWTQFVNESGASAANWTATNGTGTWSSDGTSLNRTDASGAWGIDYLKTDAGGTAPYSVVRAVTVYQAEMQCPAGGIVGLTLSQRYSNDSSGLCIYHADVDNDALKLTTFTGSNYVNDSVVFPAATWFGLRMVMFGGAVDLYYDTGSGWTYRASARPLDTRGDPYKFGVAAVNQTAKFRNIKAWYADLNLPA